MHLAFEYALVAGLICFIHVRINGCEKAWCCHMQASLTQLSALEIKYMIEWHF